MRHAIVQRLLAFFVLGFLLASQLASAKPLTYIFFISGDNNYRGPEFVNDKVKIVDKAKLLFLNVRRLAAEDSNNIYAIYYDKKGNTFPFGGHRTYFEYYSRGRRVGGEKRTRQIDSTAAATFSTFARLAAKFLPQTQTTENIFYYFGEHIPENGGGRYDSSTPKSTEFNVRSFALNLKEFQRSVPISLLVVQSCLNNSSKTLIELHDQGEIERAIIPSKPVNRDAPALQFFAREYASADDFQIQWLTATKVPSDDHHFFYYSSLSDLMAPLKRLRSELSDSKFDEAQKISATLKTFFEQSNRFGRDAQSLQSMGTFEDFSSPVWMLPNSKEYFVGLVDVVSRLFPSDQIDEWERALLKQPALKEVLVSF